MRLNDLTLKFASKDELKQIKVLRTHIFRKELAIQKEDYRDAFRDYLSKNLLVLHKDEICGCIRLAFSRSTKKFYISYFFLVSQYRKRFVGGLLIGSILYLMKINNIPRIFMDAHEEVYPLYLKFGCQDFGQAMIKNGFTCIWRPMHYDLGSLPNREAWLLSKCSEHLDQQESQWQFTIKVIQCFNIQDYENCLYHLISSNDLGSYLPHLQNKNAPDKTLDFFKDAFTNLRLISQPAFLQSHPEVQLYQEDKKEAAHKTLIHSSQDIIIVLENSPVRPMALCMAHLTDRNLYPISNWAAIPSDHPDKQNSIIFAASEEIDEDLTEQLMAKGWSSIISDSLEDISRQLIVKTYALSTEPISQINATNYQIC